MALTPKQQVFVDRYLVHFNATRAALEAGYSPKSAYSTGWENLRKPEIAKVVSERLSETAMGPEEVLMRLGDQARGSMRDFVTFDDNGNVGFDLERAAQDGKLNLAKKLKTKTRQWSEMAYSIESGEIEPRPVTETTVEFELYDAQAALVQIGKHHKLFVDKVEMEHSGSVGFTADERAEAAKELEKWQQQKSKDATSTGPISNG